MSKRRQVLWTLTLGAGAWMAWRSFPPLAFGRPETTPLTDPPGFRKLSAGAVTRGASGQPFIGLPTGDAPLNLSAVSDGQDDICTALFRPAPWPPGTVPLAFFSDVRCPICRRQAEQIAELAARHPGDLHETWHEWPIFGPPSELAARASVAAGRQGRHKEIHMRMLRTPVVVNMAYIAALADSLDLDFAQLERDMADPSVDATLAQSRHLAARFGFIGTPALVIGRTVINGSVSDSDLERVFRMERQDGPPAICG